MNEFGIIGLGVMGRNISLNFLSKNISLSVYNRLEDGENSLLESFVRDNSENYKFDSFSELEGFVNSLSRPRRILVMIKAGKSVDQLLTKLVSFVDEGDIIIDGGNSHYKDTMRRANELEKRNVYFIGCGISGGEKGARFGPSIMPGGDFSAYKQIAPYLESIAAKDDYDQPCSTYIGPNGAGHFVKMVHNGIEYAEMQVLAECYDILKSEYSNQEIALEFEHWMADGHCSYLLEITAQILRKKEGDEFIVDKILDMAGNKGTGSWSSIAAFELGSANTMMSAAVFARYISSFKSVRMDNSKKLDLSRTKLQNHSTNLSQIYKFCSLINLHQGFELLREASEFYNWDLHLDEISRTWTNGCIIRSELMKKCGQYLKSFNSLFDVPEVFTFLENTQVEVQKGITHGLENYVPMPCVSSAFNYWVSMTRENLPANLIQAQRDFFGAHTYQRVDKEGGLFFHTDWEA